MIPGIVLPVRRAENEFCSPGCLSIRHIAFCALHQRD